MSNGKRGGSISYLGSKFRKKACKKAHFHEVLHEVTYSMNDRNRLPSAAADSVGSNGRPPTQYGDPRLRHRRGLYGAAIGAAAGIPFAIAGMNDSPDSITGNIPMQEIQELNDLLGANGAY